MYLHRLGNLRVVFLKWSRISICLTSYNCTSLVTFFVKKSAGYFDLPQIWYVGPPRCADSENVPLWGGVFRPLRVTSLVTFVKESAGYFDLPQTGASPRIFEWGVESSAEWPTYPKIP